MKKNICAFLLLSLLFSLGHSGVSLAQRAALYENLAARNTDVAQRRAAENTQLAKARARAARDGLPIKSDGADLIAFDGDIPIYYDIKNVNAAISTGADLVRDTAPYNLNGLGLTAGVWDQAKVSTTTPEFSGRLRIADSSGKFSFHATHCAGTIGALGARADAIGMAPAVNIDSYDWFNDASEMAATASATATDGRLMISNHSYGTLTGWAVVRGQRIFYGLDGDNQEARGFGQYSSRARSWDEIVHNAPFYLPFKSAGNDRNDNAPPDGGDFRFSNATNIFQYSAAVHPLKDGGADGYDSITHIGIAKNIMTVGAANDAVNGGLRDPSRSTISSLSGFGPADDGRIKPDIVANGVGLMSPSIEGQTAVVAVDNYRSLSGTSMSSPNAAGSAVLIQEAAQEAGSFLRASALKGLIIHTADDLGRPGPDYSYGWGLMNAKAAIDLIRDDAQSPSNQRLSDVMLVQGATETIQLDHDQAGPIRATICWTDPAGTSSSGFDNRTPALVNDIDLRIRRVGGSTTLPYRLNVNNPTSNATRSDNTVDNTEQVYTANAAAGTYEITISHKGNLSGGSQTISLIHSGLKALPNGVGVPVVTSGGSAVGTVGSSFVYQIAATQNPTSYSVSGTLPPGLSLNTPTGRISGTPTASGTWSVTIRASNQSGSSVGKSLIINIAGLPPDITSPVTASGTQGTAFSYQSSATNNPNTWSITGNLPPGVSLNGNTGRISGTPTSAGTYTVTLRATNAHGFDERQLVVTIQSAPPVITSAGSAQGTVGSAFTYQATASNNPTVWSIAGTLPPGLSWSSTTRRITGTPTSAGTWTVTIIAANASGSGNRSVTITIAPAANIPVITNDPSVGNAGVVGTPFFFQITASNNPTSYSLNSGLPPGLSLNPATGRISGIATTSGNWTRTLRATNASGTGVKRITFRFTGGGLALQIAPVSQDFGNGLPHAANGWTYNMDAIEGQITVVDGALRLDSLQNITNANNEVILNLNVGSGNNGVDFSFRHRNRSDEARALPTSFTGSVNGDGVSMSVDGNNWVRIFDLAGESTSAWQTETLDLDQIARDNNLNFAGHVRIKFQQYDNYSVGTDGREFDDVLATSSVSPPVVTAPASVNGTVGQFFNFLITASNSPTSYSWNATIPGLTLNTSTGRIAGTPTQPGFYTLTLTATNASGSGSKTVIFAIAAAPVQGGLAIPYSQDFGGNGVPVGWGTTSNNEGRVQFINGEMVMDDTTGNSVYSLNTAGLTVNLANKNSVILSFQHRNNADENASLPATFTGLPNGDGVAMSVDGENWFRLVDFSGAPNSFQPFSANLSQIAAANNITLTASTRIRFQQYDNHPVPVDGRSFDTVRIFEGDDRPIITSSAARTGRVGSAFSYRSTASGNPTSWSVSGSLPGGLGLNTTTGVISGTPTAKGTFTFELRATNASGTGTKNITFTIRDIQPVITSPSTAMGTVGFPFVYQTTATGNPSVYTLNGTLPAGLTFNSSTGLISGTPTDVGSVDVTLRASNGSTSAGHVLSITVSQAPNGSPTPQAVPYQQAFSSSTLPAAADGWRLRSQNEGRIQIVDNALRMDSSVGGDYSLNEAELHVNMAGLSRALLQFRTFRFNDENTVLPETFTGSVNGDGVSMSVDGVNWIRIFDFTSVATSTNWVNHTVSLLAAANNAGVTLSANTRIRFQQWDNFPVNSDGRAFDTIRVRGELPVITSPATANGTVGVNFNYTITANVPVTRYTNQTLPPGLGRTDAVISGVPTQAGTFTARVYALDGNGWGSKVVTFTITDPGVADALFAADAPAADSQTLVIAAAADGGADFTMPAGYDRVLVTGVKAGAQVFDTTNPAEAVRLRVDHLATLVSKGVYFPLAPGRSIEIR